MAKSLIDPVLGSIAIRGADRIRGGAIQMGYQGSNQGMDPSYEKDINSMKQFQSGLDSLGQVFENWTQASNKKAAQTGEDRARYLLNHYTPEQLADARKQGLMLYQDDPYAMKSLHQKIGNTVALNVDNSIAEGIARGDYKSRDELDKARAKAMNEEGRKWADTYGADWDNTDFQVGLNSQVEERNIALYGRHDAYMDSFHKTQAQLQHKTENASLYSQPSFLTSPGAVDAVFMNLSKQRKEGGWDDNTAMQTVSSDIDDLAAREGGLAWLNAAEKKTVEWGGKQINVKAMFTEDQWQSLKLKASQADFKLNAAKAEDFSLKLTQAMTNPDHMTGEAQISQIKDEYNRTHPGDEMTPQRQLIIDAEQQMIQKRQQMNVESAKQLQKAQLQQGNMQILDKSYTAAINGQNVPTDHSMIMGVDGKAIDKDDAVAYAHFKMNQISQLDIPDEQKNALRLQLMQHDKADGPFRAYYTDQLAQANNEWNRMSVAGKDTGSHPNIDAMMALYKSNPEMVAQTFPDQMGMFTRMEEMDAAGMSIQDVLDAEAEATSLKTDPVKQREVNDNWTTQVGNSAGSDLGDMTALNGKTAEAAKQVFYAQLRLGKDYETAFKSAQGFVKKNVVQFTASDTEGTSYGNIPKTALMVSDNPASYSRGQELVNQMMKTVEDSHPELVGHLAVEADRNGNVIIRSPIEGFHFTVTNKDLRDLDAQTQQQVHTQARNKAEKASAQNTQMRQDFIYQHVGEGNDIPAQVLRTPVDAYLQANKIVNEAYYEGKELVQGAGKKLKASAERRAKSHKSNK
ncbi:MAG: hypothetical protein EOM68_00065 [Spirochaetia bacterium]|nr:hypothetical protein [Spirochaetia bacterium]